MLSHSDPSSASRERFGSPPPLVILFFFSVCLFCCLWFAPCGLDLAPFDSTSTPSCPKLGYVLPPSVYSLPPRLFGGDWYLSAPLYATKAAPPVFDKGEWCMVYFFFLPARSEARISFLCRDRAEKGMAVFSLLRVEV